MGNIDRIQLCQHSYILKGIVDEIEDCLFIYDRNGQLIYVNRQVEYLTGYRENELMVGTELSDLGKAYMPSLIEKMKLAIISGRKFDTICHLAKKDGTLFYLSVSVLGVLDEVGNIDKYICLAKDITSTKALHEKMHEIKYVDEVTKLPNQKAFIEALYSKMDGGGESNFYVALIDVTKMSYINNTYGLASGHKIIKEIGGRIQGILHSRCILAKLSTDVFALLHCEKETKQMIDEVMEQIFKQLEEPIKIEDRELYVEVNCGIAMHPIHGDTPGQLMNKAQMTLDKAKENKMSNDYLFYEEAMQEEVQNRILLESDMHKAYKNNEFIVYYQPFIDLVSKELTGMEALLRRKRSTGEIVLPGSFIGLLEQMELIEQVGIRVLEVVCKQLREWKDKGYKIVPMSINLSSTQFKNKQLAEDIIHIVEKYCIDPKFLVLEITETVVMTDVERANCIIAQLKAYGFTIAIDDFGTGYSSLGYLKKFLFDHLKIDISFIREIVENPQDRAIVAAIISIAKALKLKTVAEGIETLEQLNIMHEMGCEIGQGYYWDAPIDALALEEKYLKK